MKKIVYVLIVVLIILLSIVGYIVFSQPEPPPIFDGKGEVRHYIIVDYADGTTDKIETSKIDILGFISNGKPVEKLRYTLEAKSDNVTIYVRLDEFKATFEIFDSNDVKVDTYIIPSEIDNNIITVGTTWIDIFNEEINPSDLLGLLNPDEYRIRVYTDNIFYRINAEWKETGNPGDLDFNMQKITDVENGIFIEGYVYPIYV